MTQKMSYTVNVEKNLILDGSRKIWITAINDAPVISYTGVKKLPTFVDVTKVIDEIVVSDDDMEDDGVMTVIVRSSHGTIKMNERDGMHFEGKLGSQGMGYEKEVKFHAPMGDVNVALKDIEYLCRSIDGCVPGIVDQLIVIVSDNGGSGKGGNLSAELVLQVEVIG